MDEPTVPDAVSRDADRSPAPANEPAAVVTSAPLAERASADDSADARSELLRLASALRQTRDPRLLASFLRLRRRPHGA